MFRERGYISSDTEMVIPIVPGTTPLAPHCDASILHAPGECYHCDQHPEWQRYRQVAGIAFTGHNVLGGQSPCPSTYHRNPDLRDRWYGNAPVIREEEDPAGSVPGTL